MLYTYLEASRWLAREAHCGILRYHDSRLAIGPTKMTMRLLSRVITRPRLQSRGPTAHATYGSVGTRHLTNNGFFRVSEEVREALHSNKPVVALETTIYTHGEDEHTLLELCVS